MEDSLAHRPRERAEVRFSVRERASKDHKSRVLETIIPQAPPEAGSWEGEPLRGLATWPLTSQIPLGNWVKRDHLHGSHESSTSMTHTDKKTLACHSPLDQTPTDVTLVVSKTPTQRVQGPRKECGLAFHSAWPTDSTLSSQWSWPPIR